MSKKGFIYLFEIVIVSVILIVSIPYIIPPFEGEVDWSRAKLTLTGKDMLQVLEEEGYLENIMNDNSSSVNDHVRTILGKDKNTIGFNIKSEGAYKKQIRVACNCTTSERIELQSILTPTYLNGRMMDFNVFGFNFEDLEDLDMDVIFLHENNDLTAIEGGYISDLKRKINEGVGIVEFVNLTDPLISNTEDTQKKIFGIESNSKTSGTLAFRNKDNASKMNYKLSEMFTGVDSDVFLSGIRREEWHIWNKKYNVSTWDSDGDGDYEVNVSNDTLAGYEYVALEEGDKFTIDTTEFSVEKIMKDGTTVTFNMPKDYEFHNFVSGDAAYPTDNDLDRIALQSPDGKPAVIVNRTRNKGRTVWISRGRGDDVRGLVKAGVVWASRRGWWNILKSVSGEKIRVRRFVSQGDEVYEPYNVLMELWYLY
ncbi:MAG: hypothetical protein ABEK36_01365 [Candidatus Aenigmatarchaeota archaeon]